MITEIRRATILMFFRPVLNRKFEVTDVEVGTVWSLRAFEGMIWCRDTHRKFLSMEVVR